VISGYMETSTTIEPSVLKIDLLPDK
jgi:hypothetical protein